MRLSRLSLFGGILAFLLASGPARAEEPEKPAWYTAAPKRRAGVVIGLGLGFELGAANMYPNKADDIGDPAKLQSTGLTVGGGGGFTLMGAVADFLNVGVFFSQGIGSSATYRSSSAGFGLRVEGFPLYSLVPSLQDLALFAQFGFGIARAETKDQSLEPAQVMQSFASIGAFHEWTVARFWGGHLTVGPSGELDVAFGQSGTRTGFLLGPRVAFYGGL
jgi:hypothetical protein